MAASNAIDPTATPLAGALVGLMVGDALGLPREGLTARRSRRVYGDAPQHGLLPGCGLLSDDSEHALIVLHALARAGGDPSRFQSNLARGLRRWFLALPPGVGLATLRACGRLCLGYPPSRSGVPSAGNGPAMRAPILGVALANADESSLWAFVDASTRITHTDPRAVLGARILSDAGRTAALGMRDPRLVPQYLSRARELVSVAGSAEYAHQLDLVAELVPLQVWDPTVVLERFGWRGGVSGYICHTVAASLLCWLRNPGDFQRALSEVLSLGGDADTTGAVVGCLCGAGVGVAGIPKPWVRGIIDYPLTVRFALETAGAVEAKAADGLPRWPSYPLVLARNGVLFVIVLGHAARRLLTPYG